MKLNFKTIGVALGVFALATMNSMAAVGLDDVVADAVAWIAWGAIAITSILGAGVGIYAAKWGYTRIVKGGLGTA